MASISIKLTKDDISPSLRRGIRMASNPVRILTAAGTELVSITKRAFRDPSLRLVAWAAKRDGTPSNLIAKGVLVITIRIVSVDAQSVTIGTDRKYAAIHQLGGVIRPKAGGRLVFTIGGQKIFAKKVTIPARPFFPFTPEGQLAPFAQPKVSAIIQKAVSTEMSST